jgi:hypothetical protein
MQGSETNLTAANPTVVCWVRGIVQMLAQEGPVLVA